MFFQHIGLPLRQSYVSGIAKEQEPTFVLSVSNLPTQITSSVSPMATGAIFDDLDLYVPFIMAALFQLTNVCVMCYLRIYTQKKKKITTSKSKQSFIQV